MPNMGFWNLNKVQLHAGFMQLIFAIRFRCGFFRQPIPLLNYEQTASILIVCHTNISHKRSETRKRKRCTCEERAVFIVVLARSETTHYVIAAKLQWFTKSIQQLLASVIVTP